MKIAFVTDSGTGKSVGELAQAEIYSVPLQVSCDNKIIRIWRSWALMKFML